MGGGATKHADEDWDDVPIEKVPVQADGTVQSRINTTEVQNSLTLSNDFGRLKTDNERSNTSKEVLEAQAAAHWHRVIMHAREQRDRAIEAGEEVPCPLCGQMTEDPDFCGFCGDIQEAMRELKAAEEEQEAKLKKKGNSFSLLGGGSRSTSPGGSNDSPQGSPSGLRVLWNKEKQSYDRVELQPSPTQRRSVVINQDNV